MVVGATVVRGRSAGLRLLLLAGIIDSSGLAFGWTVFLLVVAERGGIGASAVQSAAALVGVAASAPVVAWLSTRWSPRDQLRLLAVGEGACRVGLFGLVALEASGWLMAPVVTAMNVLAWSGYAAMRREVSRVAAAGHRPGSGRSLTWYAIAIAASEALAAGAAALVLETSPPPPVVVAIAVLYGASLAPQWLVGSRAPDLVPRAVPAKVHLTAAIVPGGLGSLTFVAAAGPTLLATVLAHDRHGATGVMVSAVAFALCSLAATRLQSLVDGRRPTALWVFGLGALMIGGWSVAEHSLVGLAVAQGLAGLALCTLEGDLDARVVSALPEEAATAGLAYASSSRALGGAVSVGLLPLALATTSLPLACAVAAGGLLAAAAGAGLMDRRSGRAGGRHAHPVGVWIPAQRREPVLVAAATSNAAGSATSTGR